MCVALQVYTESILNHSVLKQNFVADQVFRIQLSILFILSRFALLVVNLLKYNDSIFKILEVVSQLLVLLFYNVLFYEKTGQLKLVDVCSCDQKENFDETPHHLCFENRGWVCKLLLNFFWHAIVDYSLKRSPLFVEIELSKQVKG